MLIDLLAARDPIVVGAKAAQLGRLLELGFPIPPGVVVPPDATIDAEELIAALGDGPLAIRSSAADEDGQTASLAGMYDTELDVRGAAAIEAAVGRVRASGQGARAAATRASDDPIAVLAQPMVPATCAGVAFTADPVSGDRTTVRIGAVAGIGASLVDGSAIGDDWNVGTDVRPIRDQLGVLTEHLAGEVARLARAVETAVGRPQDVEWAWDGRQLWLLQARPMTGLG